MSSISKYKVYFYSEPYFLVLDKESILDINLKTKKDKTKIIEIQYLDSFFDHNLKNCNSEEWSLTVQVFDENDKFTTQIDVYGENLKLKNRKKQNTLILEYNQISNNSGWASTPKVFETAEFVYEKTKQSYRRDLILKELLK